MKKYRVNVNGSLYEIEIEEMAAPAKMSAAAPAAAPDAAQSVKKGDVLVILEAMKMENEICAPSDGKITGVNVRKGDSVETQALLCTIA